MKSQKDRAKEKAEALKKLRERVKKEQLAEQARNILRNGLADAKIFDKSFLKNKSTAAFR